MKVDSRTRRPVAIAALAAIVACANPAWAATSSLNGHVYGPDGATPLAGARVLLAQSEGSPIVTSQPAAADGAFSVAGLAPGTYHVALQTAQGTYAVNTPISLAPGATRTVAVSAKGSSGASKGAAGGFWSTKWGSVAGVAIVVGSVLLVGNVIDNSKTNTGSPSSPSPSNPD